MSNQIEQIRAEMERQIHLLRNSIMSLGDYGQSCQIEVYEHIRDFIDQLPTKENPILVPADVQEDKAAMYYYLNLPNSSYGEGGNLLPRSINDAFKAGIAFERERLMKEAVDGTIKFDRVIPNRYAVFAEVNPKKFKPGEEVGVIIIKKEK